MDDYLFAALGLVILLLAGDSLVRGAVNASLRLGVPALIVSLTIVAFGTSAPELLISIQAIDEGAPGIALGNVVGSNIANILLVLGVPALISRLSTSGSDAHRDFAIMIGVTILFIAAAFLGPITWMHGIVFLAVLSFVLTLQFRAALAHRRAGEVVPEEDVEGAEVNMPWPKIAMFSVLGLIGLPLGADLLVDASVDIARDLGVSETVIGLTLVAIGTSLPELATTVMAAIRRQADVALGNVIGSNMFNLLAIIGIASFFGPLPVDPVFLKFDLWVMLAASVILAPFVFAPNLNLTRRYGAIFTALYVAYLLHVVLK